MFHIGDQIVHPLHGAGVIEDIVERTIDGTLAQYYAPAPRVRRHAALYSGRFLRKAWIRPVCSRAQAEAFLHS